MGEKETTREVNQLPICSFRFFVRPLVSPFCTDESGADRSKEEFMSVSMESKFMDFYVEVSRGKLHRMGVKVMFPKV